MNALSERISQAESTVAYEYSAVEQTGNVLGRHSGACLRSAIALMLALSVQGQAMATSNDSSIYEFDPIVVTAPSYPIDRDEWIPSPMPYFEDFGFDPYYIPDGYWEAPRTVCSTWLDVNEPPSGCNANLKPPPVGASTPPCGPDGSGWSEYIPQFFAPSCMGHDVCYSQLNTEKTSCDNAFHTNMGTQCESTFLQPYVPGPLPGFYACMNAASTFYIAVHLGGEAAFTTARNQAECRQWHERKENESTCP